MESKERYLLVNNKRVRILVAFVVTLALVLTMIPLSAAKNKVDAKSINLIEQTNKTSTYGGIFTNTPSDAGFGIEYSVELKYRAPLYIKVVSALNSTSPTALTGSYDFSLRKGTDNTIKPFYTDLQNNEKATKSVLTAILDPGTYIIYLATNNSTKSWNMNYELSVSTKGNLSDNFYLSKGVVDSNGVMIKSYTGTTIDFISSIGYGGKKTSPLLERNKEYTLKYSNDNVKIGTGIVTVTGDRGFYGSFNSDSSGKYLKYAIIPSKATIYKKKTTISATRPSKRQLKIKWKKISSANYYQIKYRVKGTSKWKSKTVSASKTSLTIKKLKKGKKYQYKVRGMQKLKGYTTYYSKYSKTKTSAKIK